MGFSEKAKLTALAIVHIFETSKPFGDYSAVAVLNDGAGVSYGINQFTHRSGSLYAVINTYLGSGGTVGRDAMERVLPQLKAKSHIVRVSDDGQFKTALRAAGRTQIMREAQQQIAENMYLQPALDACEGSGFECPLSLAVIYDSINHGSFAKIRDRVPAGLPETSWIHEYVKSRDAWLESIPRLAVTDYRTDFFLAQIARGNWNLDLPLNVHGHRLTDADIDVVSDRETAGAATTQSEQAVELPAVVQPEPAPVIEPTQESSAPSQDEAPPPAKEEGEKGSGGEGEFKAFVPQIDKAKAWLKRATAGTGVGAVLAFVFKLPEWLQIGLFSLLVIIVLGTIVMFIMYHKEIFAYVTKMNTLRATEDAGSPVIVGKPPTD